MGQLAAAGQGRPGLRTSATRALDLMAFCPPWPRKGRSMTADEFHGPMAIEYEQEGRRAVGGGLSAGYIDEYLIRWMTENAGCTIIRVFDAVAEARQKFPPGTRVAREDRQPAMRWHGTVTGGHAPADAGGCTVAVRWDWHGTSAAIPVTALSPLEEASPTAGSRT
jgi:hypothetical protein